MAYHSVLQLQIQTTLREVTLILILSVVVGLSVNMIRSGGIPVITNWFTESRLTTNDTVIITYCDGETCDLSHELALFLKDMGFFNVKILFNGWTVWQEMHLPVEGGSFGN